MCARIYERRLRVHLQISRIPLEIIFRSRVILVRSISEIPRHNRRAVLEGASRLRARAKNCEAATATAAAATEKQPRTREPPATADAINLARK